MGTPAADTWVAGCATTEKGPPPAISRPEGSPGGEVVAG